MTGAIVVGIVLLFVAIGSKGSPLRRALSLGAGASVGFALLAAITKSMTDVLLRGIGPLFSSWQLYALALIGLGSFIVMQSAFQVGPFAASQATLILVNPFVSIVIGLSLIHISSTVAKHSWERLAIGRPRRSRFHHL